MNKISYDKRQSAKISELQRTWFLAANTADESSVPTGLCPRPNECRRFCQNPTETLSCLTPSVLSTSSLTFHPWKCCCRNTCICCFKGENVFGQHALSLLCHSGHVYQKGTWKFGGRCGRRVPPGFHLRAEVYELRSVRGGELHSSLAQLQTHTALRDEAFVHLLQSNWPWPYVRLCVTRAPRAERLMTRCCPWPCRDATWHRKHVTPETHLSPSSWVKRLWACRTPTWRNN